MGYYAERQDRAAQDKAKGIAEENGGEIVVMIEALIALEAGRGVFCIVHNGPFEAAGFVYDKSEWNKFHHHSDLRFRQYVVMDREKAEEISGFIQSQR